MPAYLTVRRIGRREHGRATPRSTLRPDILDAPCPPSGRCRAPLGPASIRSVKSPCLAPPGGGLRRPQREAGDGCRLALIRCFAAVAGLVLCSAAPAHGQDDPTVGISAVPTVAEGGKAAFTLTLSHAGPTGIGVKYQQTQSGLWTFHSGSQFSIGQGETKRTWERNIKQDDFDEPNGSITIKLLPGNGYLVGEDNTATVIVTDNEPTPVTLDVPAGDIAEGASKTLGVTLARALEAGEKLTVGLAFSGQAMLGMDFSLSAPNRAPEGVSYTNLSSSNPAANPPGIVFTGQAGASATATVILATLVDRVDEPDETLTVGLGTLTGVGLGGGGEAASGALSFKIEDVTEPEVSVDAATTEITEGGVVKFDLAVDPAPSVNTTLKLRISQSGGYLANGVAGVKQIPIRAGVTTASYSAATAADSTDEAPGSVTATVQSGTGYVVARAPANAATVALRDDDPTVVTLAVTDAEAAEANGTNPGEFQVTLGRYLAFGESLDVPVLFAAPQGVTFTLTKRVGATLDTATNTIRFGRGKNASTIRLVPHSDGNAVDDVIVVDIPRSSTGSPRLGADALQGRATGTRTGNGQITSWDRHAKRTFQIMGGKPITEGMTTTFTLRAEQPVFFGVFVYVEVTQKGDFVKASSLGTKTVQIGGRAREAEFTVATVGDSDDEAHGEVIATIKPHTKYNVAEKPNNSARVFVSDDDDPPPVTPTVAFAAASATVAEDGSAATIGVTISPAPVADLTLKYGLTGSATHGSDYTIAGVANNAGTLAVTKDAKSASITVTITDDALHEGVETVVLRLASGTGYSVGKPGSTTLTITDDDPAPVTPTVAFAAASASVAENGASATIGVAISPAPTADLTLNYGLAGSATHGSDYTIAGVANNAGTLAVTKGAKSASVAVKITNDALGEEDETVVLNLVSGTGYSVGKPGSTTLTITDDEPALKIAAAAATADEGSAVTFTVSADKPAAAAIAVGLTLAGSGDFAAANQLGDRTLTITKGSSSASLMIATVNDKTDEPRGWIRATLKESDGYRIPETAGKTIGNVPVGR